MAALQAIGFLDVSKKRVLAGILCFQNEIG